MTDDRGLIPVSVDEYDRLYPQYEKALRERAIEPDTTFQEWLRQRRDSIAPGQA